MSLRTFFRLFLTFAMAQAPATSATTIVTTIADSCNNNGVVVYSKDCLDQLARDRTARQKKHTPAAAPTTQAPRQSISPPTPIDTRNTEATSSEVPLNDVTINDVTIRRRAKPLATPSTDTDQAAATAIAQLTTDKPDVASTPVPIPEIHRLPVAAQTIAGTDNQQITAPVQPDSIGTGQRTTAAAKTTAKPTAKPTTKTTSKTTAIAATTAIMAMPSAPPAPAACDDKKIIDAAEKGRLDILKQCAPSPEQLSHIDTRRQSYGRTPLHWGALSGSSQLVAYLISQQADPARRARMDRGAQPAHLAALAGNTDILALLQQSDSDLMDQDYLKQTPLHLAARNGSRETVQWLLSQGARLEARDRMSRTPLMTAARYNNPDAAQALLEAGADPAQATPKGLTALHLAAQHSLSVARLLLDNGVDIDAETLAGHTPLSRLASDRYNRYQTNIQFLLDRGATLNRNGATLLSTSLAANQLSLFKQLLNMGANPDQLTLSRLKNKPLFVQALNESGHL